VRLYSAHLDLRVKLQRAGRQASSQRTSVRLALLAGDDQDARARAIRWLEDRKAEPWALHTFGSGMRDAIEVDLEGVEAFPEDGDVMVIR
jgi:hypothetical protein